MKSKRCVVGCIAGVVLACVGFVISHVEAQVPQYTITPLNLVAGEVTATGLNNLGEVVGYYKYSPNGYYHAFLYSYETFTVIAPVNYYAYYAYDINDYGEIAGAYDGSSGDFHPFVYMNGTLTDLANFSPCTSCFAYAINNSGQVVGTNSFPSDNGLLHAVLFWQGNIIDLGVLQEGYSSSGAYAINDNTNYGEVGQIVGDTSSPYGDQAFLYDKDTMIDIGKAICSTFGASRATGINNVGQIVGYCVQEGNALYLPFIYTIENGTHTFIGKGGNSNIVAINDLGQVVGTDTNGNLSFPFLWMNGQEYNLYESIPANSGLTNVKPVAINNKGQILANADEASILLTPVNQKEN